GPSFCTETSRRRCRGSRLVRSGHDEGARGGGARPAPPPPGRAFTAAPADLQKTPILLLFPGALRRPTPWDTPSPMLVTPPTIGRLLLRPRRWAHRQVRAGHFGPAVRIRGRALGVRLAAVEAYAGRRFSNAQLAAAGIHHAPQSED